MEDAYSKHKIQKKKRVARSGQLVTSETALQNLFNNGDSALSQQFIRWKLWRQWESYVGAQLAEVCQPVGYARGTLFLWVKNSSWMQQIAFMLGPIRSKINQRLGRSFVAHISLTLNPGSVPGQSQTDSEFASQIDALAQVKEKTSET